MRKQSPGRGVHEGGTQGNCVDDCVGRSRRCALSRQREARGARNTQEQWGDERQGANAERCSKHHLF